MMAPSLADIEKTYSGLADGCAAAGKAGCRLIELTGDNVSGDAVKTLLNDIHDVIDSFPRPVHRTDSSFTIASPRAVSRGGRHRSCFPHRREKCGC